MRVAIRILILLFTFSLGVQPGTCFTFQTGHILYTLGPIFGVWYFIFVVVAAEAVEMWESPLLGFPYFHRLIICL